MLLNRFPDALSNFSCCRMMINGNERLNMKAAFASFSRALANVLFGLWTTDLVKPRELRRATATVLILGVALSAAGTAISLSLLFIRGRRGQLMRRQFRWLSSFATMVLDATLVIRGFILVLAALSLR